MNDSILATYQQRFTSTYPRYLPNDTSHIGDVYAAVHYSMNAGGKRLRPALVYAVADSLGIALEKVDSAAVAIECIHTYSLIHDDLPDMDDDDMRRGAPSCHKQFSPAAAILAGDALNTLAFEILAHNKHLPAQTIIGQISQLASCAGINGMIAGQDTDISCENAGTRIDVDTLSRLHINKTAKMIQACFVMAYLCADNATEENITTLTDIASKLGLLYQIQDDILDVTQSSEVLGKPAASDIANNKSTYVSLLGIDAAQNTAEAMKADIIEGLQGFFFPERDFENTPLYAIVTIIFNRQH